MRKLWVTIEILVIAGGLLATVVLISARTATPAVCLVQVQGISMLPTLRPGDELLFARLPFVPGDVVLADVGEPDPVVKRIENIDRRIIFLAGDNRSCSATYRAARVSILAVMVCRTPFRSPAGWAIANPSLAGHDPRASAPPGVAGPTLPPPIPRADFSLPCSRPNAISRNAAHLAPGPSPLPPLPQSSPPRCWPPQKRPLMASRPVEYNR